MKDRELERAKHAATPCNMGKKKKDSARNDESEEENRRDRHSARPHAIGMMRVMVTTRTERK